MHLNSLHDTIHINFIFCRFIAKHEKGGWRSLSKLLLFENTKKPWKILLVKVLNLLWHEILIFFVLNYLSTNRTSSIVYNRKSNTPIKFLLWRLLVDMTILKIIDITVGIENTLISDLFKEFLWVNLNKKLKSQIYTTWVCCLHDNSILIFFSNLPQLDMSD